MKRRFICPHNSWIKQYMKRKPQRFERGIYITFFFKPNSKFHKTNTKSLAAGRQLNFYDQLPMIKNNLEEIGI